MAESDSLRRRVFFALWPDVTTAARLAQAGKQLHALCGGRVVRRDMLHMTLLFLGNIPGDRIENLRHAAARVTASAFTLRFERWACWRRKQLAWAGCNEAPLPLLALAGQLAERLAEEGLPLEPGAFVAHITLLRKARCVPLPEFDPFHWQVSDFVLAESTLAAQGAHYDIIGRWPLTPVLD